MSTQLPQQFQVTPQEIAAIRARHPQLASATDEQIRRMLMKMKHDAAFRKLAEAQQLQENALLAAAQQLQKNVLNSTADPNHDESDGWSLVNPTDDELSSTGWESVHASDAELSSTADNLSDEEEFSESSPDSSIPEEAPVQHPHTNFAGSKSWQSLAAATLHNRSSPLLRLPDTVLIRLLQVSPAVTVEVLRRTSRTFLRLFPEAYGPPSCNPGSVVGPATATPWPTSEQMILDEQVLDDFDDSARDKDDFCADCHAASRAPDYRERWKQLFRWLKCAPCDAWHPACLFSPAEREKSEWHTNPRVCIAHEGKIAICRHGGFSWKDIKAAMPVSLPKSQSPASFGRFGIIDCEGKSHKTPCGTKSTLGSVLSGRGGRVLSEWWNVETKPRAVGFYEDQGLWVQFLNDQHVPVALAPNDPPGRSFLDPEELRKGLLEHYVKAGQYICPPLEKQRMPAALFCDPAVCACVEYPGLAKIGWAHPSDSTQLGAGKDCRTDPALGVRHARFSHQHPANNWTPSSWTPSPHNRPKPEGRSCHSRCRGSDVDRMSTRLTRCERGRDSCLISSYRHTFKVRTRRADGKIELDPDLVWFENLDPESYKLTEDAAGYGITWCWDEKCAHFWRRRRLAFDWCRLGYDRDVTLRDGEY